MKKTVAKIITISFIVIMLLSTIQSSVLATTNTEEKFIIQKEEKQFIIYYKEMIENEFNFAFSETNNEEEKENLMFYTSVKDELQEEKLNVAYVNESIYQKYFEANENKAYIWIKDAEGNYQIEGDEIDLSGKFMTDEKIDFVNNTTKRINGEEVINPDNAYKNIWTDDEGVKHTVILSQYVIDQEQNTNYYYQIVKIPNGETESETAKLYELADKLENGIESKYEQFITQQEFYNLYQKLQPKTDDSGWKKIENATILEPEDTITGDKYIIWLKADSDGEITQDAKFLLCYQEDEEEVTKYTPVETVKLPLTYDNIALIVAFVVAIALIIVVCVLRKKSTNKKEAKH